MATPKMKHYATDYIKTVFNDADFAEWLKLNEKGERLGAIIRNPAARSQHSDASRGIQKIGIKRGRLLKKYNLSVSE